MQLRRSLCTLLVASLVSLTDVVSLVDVVDVVFLVTFVVILLLVTVYAYVDVVTGSFFFACFSLPVSLTS